MRKPQYLILILLLGWCLNGFAQTHFVAVKGESVVFFCQQKDVKYAQSLLAKVDERITGFQETIGLYPDPLLPVIVAPDEKYYAKVAQVMGPIGEESQALFTFQHNLVYIRNPRDSHAKGDVVKTILHEYIHFFISQYFIDAPLWFHEGMAVYFSGQYDFELGYTLAKSYMMRTSETIVAMNRYPESRLEWNSFYAKSAMAVRYLSTQHKEQFLNFWNLSQRTKSFESAFYQAFYHSVQVFSQEVEGVVRREVAGYIILVIMGLIWAILPIFLIMGYLRRQVLRSQMPDEDEPDDLEYMEGDIPDEISPENEQKDSE